MNEEGGCDEKDDCVPKEVMVRNFTLKELTEILHSIESTVDEMVET